MSKKTSYLLGIALTIILGTFLYQKFCCNCCANDLKSDVENSTTVAPNITVDSINKPATENDTITAASKTDWAALKARYNANPLILYFNTAASNNELSEEEQQKVADLVNYSKNVSDASLLSTGHSDNVGNRDSNVKLGQNRAEFAKNYLVSKGLDASKITSESKGPDEPIADNTTADGKAKNRRTVITIQ